jgi:4-diphosphocytidyl-2-C-methyl-D-erythritol kinase
VSVTSWPAPAKVNLFLRVTGRRDDGYHSLQTVFQFLELSDEVRVAVRPDGAIRRLHELPGVPPERDLSVRAALALRQATGCPLGADLRVDKRVPAGGGLGGGSSDAATVLVALNRLWGLGLGADALAGIGLGLGADVPVFVRGQAAWAEGVGERLTPVGLDEPWYLVIHPGCEVPTAAVFGDPELTRDSPPLRIRGLFQGVEGGLPYARVGSVLARAGNDCEAVVRLRFPPVDEALRWLGRHAPARMTGTGACVFAPFPGEEAARDLARVMPSGWRGFVCQGRNVSPLVARAATGTGPITDGA